MTKAANPSAYLGIEIGGTKLQIFAEDAAGQTLAVHRLAVEASAGAAGIQRQIASTLAQLLPTMQLAGVGVGFGGPVNWQTGRICRSHQIAGWSEFDLVGWLQVLTGAPVFVDNDANVAALGEARHGAGAGRSPVFYVTLGSGVGGGLVVAEKIYHGATPGEAEIGHLRLDRTGTILESRCSGWAVDAKIRALKNSDPASVLCQMMAEPVGGEARHLKDALAQNDPVARRILLETAEDLAFGLSHVVQLFHPEVIVLGGGLSSIGEPLRAAVSNALKPWTMEAFAPGLQVCLAALGERAVPVGALELARQPGRTLAQPNDYG